MPDSTHIFQRFRRQRHWQRRAEEWFQTGLVVFPLAVLFCWHLGSSPVRGDEAPLLEMARLWLANVLNQGLTTANLWANLGRSPLTVLLISFGKVTFGPTPGAERMAGALLNGLSLPVLYWLGKNLYGKSLNALLTVVVYGTSLGVVHNLRWAGVNTLLLPLVIFFLASLLFCRRDLRGGLPLGLSGAGLALTDLHTACLLLTTSFIFLHWDTPRLKHSRLFWLGFFLGGGPAIAWWGGYFLLSKHSAPFIVWEPDLWQIKISGWFWLLASAPGLIFAFPSLAQAQQSLHWSWARFLVCQGGIYGLLIIISPWSSNHLITGLFAPLALGSGLTLGEVYEHFPQIVYPLWWRRLFLILAGLCLLTPGAIYYNQAQGSLADWTGETLAITTLFFILMGVNFLMTAILIDRQRAEFISVLFWGLFICLWLAIYSPFWNFTPAQSRSLPMASTTNQFPAGL